MPTRIGRISIGRCLGEGFRLIARRPVSVLVWGAIQLVSNAIFTWLVPTGLYNQAHKGAGAPLPSLFQGDLLAQLRGALGVISGLVLFVVLICAIWRAVLKPEERRFAYLRAGASEAGLILLSILVFTSIVLSLSSVTVFISHENQIMNKNNADSVGLISMLIGGALVIAICLTLFWIFPRFALLGPATVQAGQLRIGHAWRITSGHVIAILVLAACISICSSIVEGIIDMVGEPIGRLVAPLSKNSNIGAALEWLAGLPIAGGALALSFAPWARAYRDVAGPDPVEAFD